MITEKVDKEHIEETIRDIQSALEMVEPDKDNNDYALMTLLCRVGELELCLNYNFELKNSHGKHVELLPNRLCKCYVKLGGDDYEV